MAQALLPLKDLVQAKTRLSGLLRPSERRALAQAMAEDVLAVLAGHADVTQITLVSDDPGAAMLADKYGAECWSEHALGCRGLNALMQCASERLLAAGAHPLLVLHCDLPLLAAEDIDAVLAQQRELEGLVIACDRQGRGTNLLAFDACSVPQFCFGPGSSAAHLASARSAGFPALVQKIAGIAVDVDEPLDLHYVMDRLQLTPRSNTAALLNDTGLGSRIALALAAMTGAADTIDAGNRGFHN